MSGGASAEAIIGEVARAFQQLADEFAADRIRDLLADLGLQLPPELTSAQQFMTAISNAATAITDLIPLIDQLETAIENEDVVGAIQFATQIADKLRQLPDRLDAVATSLSAVAGSLPGVSPAVLAGFVAELPRRLLDYVVVSYLQSWTPGFSRVLALAGLVEIVQEPGTPGDPLHPPFTRRTLRLDLLPQLISDAGSLANSLYGWGTEAADLAILLRRLHDAVLALSLPAAFEETAGPDGTPELRLYWAHISRTPAGISPPGLEAALQISLADGVEFELPFFIPNWTIRTTLGASLEAGAAARLQPGGRITIIPPAGTVSGSLLTELVAAPTPPATSIVLLGSAGGTRLEAKKLAFGAGARFTNNDGDLLLSARIEGGRLDISLGGADGFLASVLPRSLGGDTDPSLAWDGANGLTFSGGAGLSLTLPLALSLGPARLDRLDLALAAATTGLALEARISGSIALGPFAATVEGVGGAVTLAFRKGNLGPADLAFRFLPPTGLGLSIDAGPIRGGGFIDFDEPKGRYFGQLQLSLGVIGISATGLLDTKLPGGRPGFALLVILRGEFPPIQLGFGFALSSVGGLLGLNRQIDIDALRERFATGTVGRILAPEDPVRDAAILLADLEAVFPPVAGIVVVGPTLQLSWIELVRFDLGIFIEIPTLKVVLLGSARATIANPAGGSPLAQLRVDIIGLLDIPRNVLEFDAVLIESHLLEVFELTGGAAFRLSWGSEPYVVLSLGGFHPAWSPAPLVFPPSLRRIAAVRGSPEDFLYLRFEGYFAVTTNTLQFGAAVEAIINVGSLNARGFLGFDALIRFSPFFFQVDISASVKVRWKGRTLAGIELSGSLSGPGPVTFRGKVCIEILFLDFCWSDTFTFGSNNPPAVTPVPSAVAELALELTEPSNLRAEGGDDPLVVLNPADPALRVLRAGGQLIWSQDRAPLDLLLQRFEGTPLFRPETVTATGLLVTGSAADWFAPGSYAELSDSDALNRKPFLRLNAGVSLGSSGLADGRAVARAITIRQIRIPRPVAPLGLAFDFVIPGWLLSAGGARTRQPAPVQIAVEIAVRDETWDVRGASGTVVAAGVSEAQAHQLAKLAPGRGIAVAATDAVPAFAF